MTRNASECAYYKNKLRKMKEHYEKQGFVDEGQKKLITERIQTLQIIADELESRLKPYERMQINGYLS